MGTRLRRVPARRARRLVVGLTALLVSLTAVAPAAATQIGAGATRHRAVATTIVTLRIPHCPGCVVDVFHPGGSTSFRPLRTVPIRGGVGRFTVPTVVTHG